ncbi:hypothetical protein CONLIGDRAFT_577666 [Coniochaeta ligniaria NRRL 30616]|uniref:F-box domain-containing protein n=1 Tax=Coniochaeta ligniaria NRRL 30616 TaxID=1408157 RepID=A0A1J7JHV5_9PEZI|nr:hypothetical protein CONLIGDRAFT_577666 [Coniochaeta ligniaria NRRL 30616]
MSIRRLPFEVVALVVGHLGLDDVHSLSICSRHFRFLAYDDAICKKVLQTASASALEVQQALRHRNYARAFRRLIKRREAIASASPFLTAVLAFAETWLYENGVLCHIRERQLRLLDVHRSADQEIVVDIRKLLDEAIPESRGSRKYKFQLLYHACGVVSCLYTHARPQLAHWLVVFNPGERKVLATRRLDSAYKIFARNNSDFIYYGVQSEIGDDGFRRWVLQGFDIRKGEWLADSLNLPDTVGSEIDATICFEIIDGYFCALTNHTSFETDRIEYTSYYDFFRFPLDHPSHEHMERPTKRDLFRRQHSEGPIDDRWTFMKIFSDELSGELKILESRKEWLSGNSSATRTYYTKTLYMTERGDEARSSPRVDEEEDEDQYAQDDRLAQFLGTASKGNKGHAPDRNPSEVHVGDDGSTSVMFTLSKCFIRSYHPASQTFLDVVDDPHQSDPCDQRIRIRAGTRLSRVRSMSVGAKSSKHQHHHDETQQQVANPYEQSGVVSWPPDARSPALDDLHQVLNPPGYVGNVHGTWDQRSVIYATGGGGNGTVKALVLVSFDPSIYLKGIRSFDDRSSASTSTRDMDTTLREVQAKLTPTDKGKGKEKEREIGTTYDCPANIDEEVTVEHKSSSSSGGSGLIGRTSGIEAQTHPWASNEPAQYLTIGTGYHFAK